MRPIKTYKNIAAVIRAPRDAGESIPSIAKTVKRNQSASNIFIEYKSKENLLTYCNEGHEENLNSTTNNC